MPGRLALQHLHDIQLDPIIARALEEDWGYGADGRIYGSGSGAAYVIEGLTMRSGTLADLVTTARLGHQLPAIDFNSDHDDDFNDFNPGLLLSLPELK